MTPADETTNAATDPAAERERLLAIIQDLAHNQLIARDVELGLRAELLQARIDLEHAQARESHGANEAVRLMKRSTTWRVGRAITGVFAPVSQLARRLR
ncbi:hypothetical protein CLV46_0763 [Diaminobutyricimonas aerilata]|uniref:Uncharacterized protein n=1 Tax=Diaminobutyricimonas aerilata TaxID=1162967 RepID=A0A2M9CH22_9MICO|nr:hypothetical protein [Diaminobutyricimonas aerilata]PJJ71221.1 hypothetical protein CLV46_0763 [Diaminobutyricimonas aerilata]